MKPGLVMRRRQGGSAALVVTLILFFVMTLVAAFANRNHFFEQKASANQYRAAKAQEAAEAGLEWAIAMLNDPHAVDESCVRDPEGSTSLRERWVSADAASGALKAATWLDGSTPHRRSAVCTKTAAGWTCSCPEAAHAAVPAAPDSGVAFAVALEEQPTSGTLLLKSTGCTSLGGRCTPHGAAKTDAVAHAQVVLAVLPGVAAMPVAPLTTREGVSVGAASIGLHNTHAATAGFTVHTGGAFIAPEARLSTAAGASPADSVIDNDAVLKDLSPNRLYASVFGMSIDTWASQPAVRRLRCETGCGAALSSALAGLTGNRMLRIDGNADIEGPLTLGSADRPVALAVEGALRLKGAVVIHGVVHASGIHWSGSGGRIVGAAISASIYEGDAAADLVHDIAVFDKLKTQTGSLVRVPGSWRDF